jgi:DNA-3-methyladenine glycosylase II
MTRLETTVPLPKGFRSADILAFHRRDKQEVAERVSDTALQKGMMWQGLPACLSVDFLSGQAKARLDVEGLPAGDTADAQRGFEAMVRRMLGLTQDTEAFERRHRKHPELGRLIAAQPGLRVPIAPTPFEALTWAVTGQQITVAAAVSLRRKLIMAVNMRHASGLLCYPQAEQVAALPAATWREAGFSVSKADTLRELASQIAEGQLPLDTWLDEVLVSQRVDEIQQRLEAVRGVGPWTVNYTLLRGFAWLDGSLHGDVAVRRGLERLQGLPEPISQAQAKAWLTAFSPWRALVAAHLWASKQA